MNVHVDVYILTLQLSALHKHGEVLGPQHTIRTALVSLHKQLAVESYVIKITGVRACTHVHTHTHTYTHLTFIVCHDIFLYHEYEES